MKCAPFSEASTDLCTYIYSLACECSTVKLIPTPQFIPWSHVMRYCVRYRWTWLLKQTRDDTYWFNWYVSQLLCTVCVSICLDYALFNLQKGVGHALNALQPCVFNTSAIVILIGACRVCPLTNDQANNTSGVQFWNVALVFRPLNDGCLDRRRSWLARLMWTNLGFRSGLVHSNVMATTSASGFRWQGKMMSSPTVATIGWDGAINWDWPGKKQIWLFFRDKLNSPPLYCAHSSRPSI